MKEKFIFIKKNNPEDEVSCERCIFFEACTETMGLQDIFGECDEGDYFELSEGE